jgi:serine protease Do
MIRVATPVLILALASLTVAQSPQPAPASPTISATVPWAVSVVHTIPMAKMTAWIREQQNVRVGVAGTAPPFVYNITTGIIVDEQGHVVTRLTNLNPSDKDQKLTITTGDGSALAAKLIGVDLATGFAVLEVASLKSSAPKIANVGGLLNGTQVRILSSDAVYRSVPGKVYLTPSIAVSLGSIQVDSPYSKARGALTLRSDHLMARSDSSVVVTPDNQVVGIAQYAGFGRAYLYPIDFIRDSIAKRVIEKNDNVPAGWLGVQGLSVAQLPEVNAGGRKAGVVIREVTPDSPAAQAGITLGDIIIKVDNFEVAGTADLRALLSSLPAGQAITLSAIRDQQALELKATLGARPNAELTYLFGPLEQGFQSELSQREQLEKRREELGVVWRMYQKAPPTRDSLEARNEIEIEIKQINDRLRAMGPETTGPPSTARGSSTEYLPAWNAGDVSFRSGFSARELTPQLAASLQARGGVWVSQVVKDSPAERAGLKAGDVILGTPEKVLLSVEQLQVLLSSQHGPITLRVVRTREPIVVSLSAQ